MSDDDYEDYEPAVEALPGSLSPAGGEDDVGESILKLIAGTARLHVLLAESDEAAFDALVGRLALLRDLVARLPAKGIKGRSIGFRLRLPKRR